MRPAYGLEGEGTADFALIRFEYLSSVGQRITSLPLGCADKLVMHCLITVTTSIFAYYQRTFGLSELGELVFSYPFAPRKTILLGCCISPTT